ncbi:MAG: sensor histidine kinase, partial [Nitrospirales bacterium]
GQDQGIHVALGPIEPAVVRGNELRLRELLLNLVDNAIKYSRPGGKVELGLTCERGYARLAVTDEGIGIEPEALGRIFDRFYRTDAARAHAKSGTGLGLAICKWIAEAHQGRIDVQSRPGAGSRVTLILPLRPADTRPAGH